MIISVFATTGLVICIGENGHLALEPSHHDHQPPIENHGPTVAHAHFGDCSDTSVFLYYGRVRTDPIWDDIDNLLVQISILDIQIINTEIAITPEVIIDQSIPPGVSSLVLSTVVLIC